MMNKYGIKLYLKKAKDGKIVGVTFKIGNKMITGSSVDKLLSAMNIQKAFVNIAKIIIKQTIKSITLGM